VAAPLIKNAAKIQIPFFINSHYILKKNGSIVMPIMGKGHAAMICTFFLKNQWFLTQKRLYHKIKLP
jgi:hypothetical protein